MFIINQLIMSSGQCFVSAECFSCASEGTIGHVIHTEDMYIFFKVYICYSFY